MRINGTVLQRELFDRFLVGTAALPPDDPGKRHMCLQHVWRRYDNRLHNVFMTLEHGFDIAGIDILAGADEHVVCTVDEEKPAGFVPPEDIARVHPPVFGQHACRGFRQIVISLHHARTFDMQDTLVFVRPVDQLDVDAINRKTDRTARSRQAVGMGPGEQDRPAFGNAIIEVEPRIREPRCERVEQIVGCRRGPHRTVPHGRQIGLIKQFLFLQDQGVHRRHAGQHGQLVAFDRPDVFLRVEARKYDDAPACR